MRVTLKNKGMFISASNGSVKDSNGKLFYLIRAKKNFSLPVGTYFIDAPIKKENYNKSTCPIFYVPEKNIQFLGIKKFILSKNPNKCSIYVENGTVIPDKDFWRSLNVVQKNFILGHEMGHYFYHTEKKCDNFAAVMMLLAGFNPSQIYAAVNSTLVSEFRKKENELQLIKK